MTTFNAGEVAAEHRTDAWDRALWRGHCDQRSEPRGRKAFYPNVARTSDYAKPGQAVGLTLSESDVHLFDSSGASF